MSQQRILKTLVIALFLLASALPGTSNKANALLAGIDGKEGVLVLLGAGVILGGVYTLDMSRGTSAYYMLGFDPGSKQEAMFGMFMLLGGLALDKNTSAAIDLNPNFGSAVVEHDMEYFKPDIAQQILADVTVIDESSDERKIQIPSTVMDFIQGQSVRSYAELEKHECGFIVEVQRVLSEEATQRYRVKTQDPEANYQVGLATAVYIIEKLSVFETELSVSEIESKRNTDSCVYEIQ